jgi:hypothetical protein
MGERLTGREKFLKPAGLRSMSARGAGTLPSAMLTAAGKTGTMTFAQIDAVTFRRDRPPGRMSMRNAGGAGMGIASTMNVARFDILGVIPERVRGQK